MFKKGKNTETRLFEKFLKTGDTEVFKELYLLTKQWVYALIYRIVGDGHIANDILQDTWVKILNNGTNYDSEKGNFNNFIYTVAKNEALLYIRKNNNRNEKEKQIDDDQSSASGQTPSEILERKQLNELIRKSLLKLSDDHRDVIFLYYFAEFEIKKIAGQLEIPANTVKTRLARARNKLEEILKKNLLTF